ncbi:hypothetical protein [Streptomyces sp. NPDC059176]|uniref:hypothetical protein n=1 Tax=Streptomyces sp. NPDC059176 TaxID=3346758 RepID=UPI0036C310CF
MIIVVSEHSRSWASSTTRTLRELDQALHSRRYTLNREEPTESRVGKNVRNDFMFEAGFCTQFTRSALTAKN